MSVAGIPFANSGSPIDDFPKLIDDKYLPLLKGTIWVILLGSAILFAQMLVSPDGYRWRIYAAAGFVIFSATAFMVLRYRGVAPTLRLLCIGSWLLVTYASFVGEGIRAPILFAYPVILIFSGWILGVRFCAHLLVASSVAVLVLAVGQHTGLVGDVRPFPAAGVALIYLIVLLIGAVITLYLLRLFQERYAEECRLHDEVERNLQVVEKSVRDLRMLAEHIPALVFEVDRTGHCLFGNRNFAEFFGIPMQKLAGTPIGEVIDHDTTKELIPLEAAEPSGDLVEFVVRKRSAQGTWHSFDVTLVAKHTTEFEGVVGWYGLMHDVTKREVATAELREKANHDPLTGLANRGVLDDRLAHALEHAARQQTKVAVMMVDVDHFKEINDTLGHAAGDLLLHEVARCLKSSVRAADSVARVGGDEFVVLMEGIASDESVQAVAAKILVELSRPTVLGTKIAQVSASIGIAIYPNAGQTSEELLRAADDAMYKAKAAGRNCYR